MKILGRIVISVLFVPSLLESRLSCSFDAELKTTSLTSAGLFRDSKTSVISRSSALANRVSAARPAQAWLVRPNPATAPARPSVRPCKNLLLIRTRSDPEPLGCVVLEFRIKKIIQGWIQRPNPKKNMVNGALCRSWPHVTSPYVHSSVDSNTCTMGNPMPKSTLTLCHSRLYTPGRDFGFDLRAELPFF